MTSSQTVIRILLVDDHPLVLDGINARLETVAGIRVVGQAHNGKEALALATEVKPDVVLMDITMPVMGGLEATACFREMFPGTHVLILSMHDDQEYVVKMMQVGASGYILKDVSAKELVKAIKAVHQGESYFTRLKSKDATVALKSVPEQEGLLTQREETVLKLIAEGQCNKDVARSLDISVRTVETHRQNIKSKLKIHTAAGLTKFAIEYGLVKLI